jgi:chromosome segregation protein
MLMRSGCFTALRNSRITGARGALSNFIEVPDEYENAIASALGEYLGAVVVDGWIGVEEALEILGEGSARVALLSMEVLSPAKPLTIDISKAPVENNTIIGIGADIIKVQEELRPVVDLLLGQVVIVKDRVTARRLLSKGNWSSMPLLRIVTLKGEVFYSNGPVLSASGGQGILSRPRQRKELEAEILKANQTLSEIHISRSKLEERLLVSGENERELSLAFQKHRRYKDSQRQYLGNLNCQLRKRNDR